MVAWIIFLARGISIRLAARAQAAVRLTRRVLSAAGLFFVVLGVLQSRHLRVVQVARGLHHRRTPWSSPRAASRPVWLFVAIGALFLLWFFLHVRSAERKGQDVLLPLRLFRNKIANP